MMIVSTYFHELWMTVTVTDSKLTVPTNSYVPFHENRNRQPGVGNKHLLINLTGHFHHVL